MDDIGHSLGTGLHLLLSELLLGNLVLIVASKLLHSRWPSSSMFHLLSNLLFLVFHLNFIAILKALTPLLPELLLFYLLNHEGADAVFLLLEGQIAL